MKVTASQLHVRSGPDTTFRSLRMIPHGTRVEVFEQRGEWAWVGPFGGWVHSAYLAAEKLVRPVGFGEIVATFGTAGSPECSAGRVTLPAPLKLGWQNAAVTRVACHVKMEPIFTAVFQEIHRLGHWSLLRTFDGIYNLRKKTANSQDWSTHSWGIAVDLNAATNRFGTKGDMPPEIIEIFERHGFHHLKNDPMHFQYCRGY